MVDRRSAARAALRATLRYRRFGEPGACAADLRARIVLTSAELRWPFLFAPVQLDAAWREARFPTAACPSSMTPASDGAEASLPVRLAWCLRRAPVGDRVGVGLLPIQVAAVACTSARGSVMFVGATSAMTA
jgi:hypothetical protein